MTFTRPRPRVIFCSLFLLIVNAAHAGDWPQYGGPDRNCVSRETGLLRSWPKDGPPLLWKITDLGTGLTPVSVAGQRLYTLSQRGKDELAVALDRGTGKEIWATPLGVSRENASMSFLRQRQPLVDGERVYFFSSQGHIVCLDADAGRELWRKRYTEDFDGRSSSFGWTDNPLIDGDKILCTPGGMTAFVVALNKTSGAVVWKTVLPAEQLTSPSHAPIVALDVAGIRQYVLNSSRMIMSVAATDGKLLWTYKRVSSGTANMASVIPHGKRLFVASGFNTGCALLDVTVKGENWNVEEEYFSKEFQSLYGGLAPLGDHVYAGHGPVFAVATPCCVDMRTGKLVWKQPDLAKGAVATILADGHLYFRFADGTMILAEATPEGYKEKGRFMQPERSKFPMWSVPVIAHGRLFLRDQNVLLCYDLRRDSPIQKLPKEKPADPPRTGDKLDLKRQPDTVYIPTPSKVVDAMLKLADVTRKDVVYDLGCGDGRIPIAAARKYGASGIGIELDAELVQEARGNVKKEGLENRVTIRHGDVFFEDFQDATVVMLYLLPHLNQKLLPRLRKLRPGTRIVSHAFPIDGYPPDEVMRVPGEDGIGEHVLYLWTTPLPDPVMDWPALGRDHTRNPVSPETGAPDAAALDLRKMRNVKWTARLGTVTMGEPVIANGLVWVGTNNFQPRDPKHKEPAAALMCFRAKDGMFLYQHLTTIPKGDRFAEFGYSGHCSSPVIEGNRLWFTTVVGEVICLDISHMAECLVEPKLAWKLDMRKELGVYPSEPLCMGWGRTCSIGLPWKDFIYVITGNGVDDGGKVVAPNAPSLLCLNKETGKVVWSNNFPGNKIQDGQFSSPLVVEVDGKYQVVAPMGDGLVRSFDAVTGKLLWQCDLNPKAPRDPRLQYWNNICGTPVYQNRRVYVATGNCSNHPFRSAPGWVYCLDPTRAGDISLETIDAKGKIEPNPNSGVVWRFGGMDGTKKLRGKFSGTMGSLAIHEGLAIVNDTIGYVNCLDARTGALHWQHDVKQEISSAPLIVDGKIYVASERDVFIFALSKDKKLLGEADAVDWIDCSPVFVSGVLYLATRNTLYAFEATPRSLADQGAWPQWRGPDRTNVAREKGLLQDWTKSSPRLVWDTASRPGNDLGTGARSLAVADGRIFTLGYHGEHEYLQALLETSGDVLWKFPIGPAMKEYESMRWLSQRTPTVDDGKVFALNGKCELVCLDVVGGHELWRLDYVKEFGGAPGVWGACDYPLVDGDKLICTPGGPKATIVALDKRTGRLLWKCPVPGEERGTHASIVAADIAGQRMYIHHLETGTVGVSATDGKLLWHYRDNAKKSYGSVQAPLVRGDEVFCGNGYNETAAIIRIIRAKDEWKIHKVHDIKVRLDMWLGSAVLLDDDIHTSCGRRIDWKTGQVKAPLFAEEPFRPRCTMVYADGRLYHRTSVNKVYLTEATPQGYVKRGWFQAPYVNGDHAWSFPVIAGGKLYLRDQGRLLCYDIRDKAKEKPRRGTGFPARPSDAPQNKDVDAPRLRVDGPGSPTPDAIFVPTPQDVVEKMLELASVKKTDVVYDLGCGDGRIVVTAAEKYGCRAVGVDLDPLCVRMSLANVDKAKVGRLVKIEQQDLYTVDLSQADVIALYLGPKVNTKLLPQLRKLKAGVRIVSHQFPIEGVEPERVLRHRSVEDGVEHRLYMWTTPLAKME